MYNKAAWLTYLEYLLPRIRSNFQRFLLKLYWLLKICSQKSSKLSFSQYMTKFQGKMCEILRALIMIFDLIQLMFNHTIVKTEVNTRNLTCWLVNETFFEYYEMIKNGRGVIESNKARRTWLYFIVSGGILILQGTICYTDVYI